MTFPTETGRAQRRHNRREGIECAWQNRPPAPATLRRRELLEHILQIHAASDQSYGSPRIVVELVEQQISCGVNTVAA